MGKYVIEVTSGQKNTAGEKAKEDISNILHRQGFEKLALRISQSKFRKAISSGYQISKKTRLLNNEDIAIVQYPIYSNFVLKKLLKMLIKKAVHVIGFVHDIEFLRTNKNNEKKRLAEVTLLNNFEILIVHNESMREKLRENGVVVPMVSLHIFDYLNDHCFVKRNKDEGVIYAGNLSKAGFLEKWDTKFKLTLYGINPSKESYCKNTVYRGIKRPDDLPAYLDSGFGLVWDGDSLKDGTGVYGEYTKYNNPHKTSLYLSCGLPVIVWKNSAIASFVKANNVGITVENLLNISQCLEDVSDGEYEVLCKNAERIGNEIRSGFYTCDAVNRALKIILKKTEAS